MSMSAGSSSQAQNGGGGTTPVQQTTINALMKATTVDNGKTIVGSGLLSILDSSNVSVIN